MLEGKRANPAARLPEGFRGRAWRLDELPVWQTACPEGTFQEFTQILSNSVGFDVFSASPTLLRSRRYPEHVERINALANRAPDKLILTAEQILNKYDALDFTK